MAEYIDREAAVQAMKDLLDRPGISEGVSLGVQLRILAIPASDVALVRHGRPIIKNRPERVEEFFEAKLVDGEVLYRRKIKVIEDNPVEYCPLCGKRLCSRFSNFCPNCGAKMDG